MTELVAREPAGESEAELARRCELSDRFMGFRHEAVMRLYRGLYEMIGSYELMRLKWDFDIGSYHNLWVSPYMTDQLTDLAFLARQLRQQRFVLGVMDNFGALFRRTEQALRERGAYHRRNRGVFSWGLENIDFLPQIGLPRSRSETLEQAGAHLRHRAARCLRPARRGGRRAVAAPGLRDALPWLAVAARVRPSRRSGSASWGLLVALCFPLAAARAVELWGARATGALVFGIGLASVWLSRRRSIPGLGAWLRSLALALPGLALISGNVLFLHLVPAVIELALCGVFLGSLRGGSSILQQAAYLLEPYAPDFIGPYCRKATAGFAALFAVQAIALGWVAFSAQGADWAKTAASGCGCRRWPAPRSSSCCARPGSATMARTRWTACCACCCRRRTPRRAGARSTTSARSAPGARDAAAVSRRERSGRRVVVTGMAGLSPLGNDWPALRAGLREGRSGVTRIEAFEKVEGLRTRLGAAVDFAPPAHWPRRKTRGHGPRRAARHARHRAGPRGRGPHGRPRAQRRTHGPRVWLLVRKPAGNRELCARLRHRALDQGRDSRSDYARFMSHTCVGERRAVLRPARARRLDLQRLHLRQPGARLRLRGGSLSASRRVMLCGGAEELHEIEVAVFDLMFATSTQNDAPGTTPRPFDAAATGW